MIKKRWLMYLLVSLVVLLAGCDRTLDTAYIEVSMSEKGQRIALENASFEDDGYKGVGTVSEEKSYYGYKSLKVNSGEVVSYELDVDQALDVQLIAASTYAYLDGADAASLVVSVAYKEGFQEVRRVDLSEKMHWEYLKTDYLGGAFEADEVSRIRVDLEVTGDGYAYFDLIEVGESQALNGHLSKMAMVAYQPWYESEDNGWGNWQYQMASMYGGENSYPAQIVDGKRNIASVGYPTIGVYDSSDPEVIAYHIDLIKAMNFDVVQVNYYADLNQGMLDTFDKMVAICEEKKLKISILYEPKIHLNGWIKHDSRSESVEAIEKDIMNFLDKYQDSEAILLYEGIPVVEIFGVNQLRNVEWLMVKENLKAAGYDVHLMGDVVGAGDYSSMLGMFQWHLYADGMTDMDETDVKDFILSNNQKVLNWSQSRYQSVPVALVYPGFDDSKVKGWDLGETRKIDLTGEAFYKAAWDGFAEISDEFDWLLVATFNDWNEGTILEPQVSTGHLLAAITQEEVAAFKGEGVVDSEMLEEITEDYLKNRSTKYD